MVITTIICYNYTVITINKGYMINKLAIKHAEKRRERLLSVVSDMKVRPGWIKYMRSVLGMTLKDLAKLTNLSIPGIADAEKREQKGKITIENLSKLADAMECDFVYGFIPKEDIQAILKRKSIQKAKESILQADIHMELEDQQVDENIDERITLLAENLLEKGKVW